MKKVLKLNFEQVKVISDKNKMDILNCFELERPITVTEISEKINMPYSRLNYHVKILKKVGIIEVVDTKLKSGILEKYYLPVAEEFRIDKTIAVFENDEDFRGFKENVKKFNDAIIKEMNDDYSAWSKTMDDDMERSEYKQKAADTCMFNGVMFLNEEDVSAAKEEFHEFFNKMIDKYGDKKEGSKAYNTGNFFIVKKNQEKYFSEE